MLVLDYDTIGKDEIEEIDTLVKYIGTIDFRDRQDNFVYRLTYIPEDTYMLNKEPSYTNGTTIDIHYLNNKSISVIMTDTIETYLKVELNSIYLGMLNTIQDINIKNIENGCEKCNYTGYITDSLTGLKVKCSCGLTGSIYNNSKKREEVETAIKVKITNSDTLKRIIPEQRLNDEFSADTSAENVREIALFQGCEIVNFDKYIDTLNNILTAVSSHKLDRSYLIGSPNGFGKSTFVYTALKRLIARGKKVVPYISLSEIAKLKIEEDDYCLYRLRNSKNKEVTVHSEFKWSDFINADVLFTYLSAVESKEIESAILFNLLQLREKKGKPTVVFISTSLNPYTSDNRLRQYYWNEMLEYLPNKHRLDRLVHISTYKQYRNREI